MSYKIIEVTRRKKTLRLLKIKQKRKRQRIQRDQLLQALPTQYHCAHFKDNVTIATRPDTRQQNVVPDHKKRTDRDNYKSTTREVDTEAYLKVMDEV